MSFLKRLFSKSPADLLAKGDRYMESDSFFDARTCYQDGLELCADNGDLKPAFIEKIDFANLKLAELNLQEAQFVYERGEVVKAIDHLELVKTLTYDPRLREKAERLLLEYAQEEDLPVVPVASSGCASCGGSSAVECGDSLPLDESLPLMEYYELLIQQIPEGQSQRYADLGEEFAYAYISASRDEHHEALAGFEKCRSSIPPDIFWYEKGKVQHRLGEDGLAEQSFRTALELNEANPLVWLTFALFLRENNRFQDSLVLVDQMVERQIMAEQALLLRAEIWEVCGEHDRAVDQYVELLQTPYARAAAERLYGVLQDVGRHNDAAVIFKKYLHKSCH